MKRIIFPILTMLLSLTMFTSCSNDDDPVDQEMGEIFISTYVDDELQTTTKATTYLDGGYATGAGKYPKDTYADVAAYPNQGYKLESFTGGLKNEFEGKSSYNVLVPAATKIYFTAKFKKEDVVQNNKLILTITVPGATGWEGTCYIRIDGKSVGTVKGPGYGTQQGSTSFTYQGVEVVNGAKVEVSTSQIDYYVPGQGNKVITNKSANTTLANLMNGIITASVSMPIY